MEYAFPLISAILLMILIIWTFPKKKYKLPPVILNADKIEQGFRRSTRKWESITGFPEFTSFFNIWISIFNPLLKDKEIKSIKLYILLGKKAYYAGKEEGLTIPGKCSKKIVISQPLPPTLAIHFFSGWEKFRGKYPIGFNNFYAKKLPKTFKFLLEVSGDGWKTKKRIILVMLHPISKPLNIYKPEDKR